MSTSCCLETVIFFFFGCACRIAQEQCCSAAKELHLCLNGINMALGQGACEVPFFPGEPWEAKLSKVVLHHVSIFAFVFLLRLISPPSVQICCDCCTLGLMTARDTSGCDFQHLHLNGQCSETAKVCCTNKTMEESQNG